MGTLSSLSRYGTMNTPSLKTARERKGKAKCKTPARLRDVSIDSTVTVYHIDKQDERYTVDASFYSRKRSTRSTHDNSEAQAAQQARLDWKRSLLSAAGNNSDCD